MNTARRRQQGFRVRKNRIPNALDYFAQNGLQVPITGDPIKPGKPGSDHKAAVERFIQTGSTYETPQEPEKGFFDYLSDMGSDVYDSVMGYFAPGQSALDGSSSRLSHPTRVYNPSNPVVNVLTDDSENFDRQQRAVEVDRLVRGEPISAADRLLKGVAAERYPDVTDFSQLDKFNMVTTGTETGTFDKPKAYKTRQRTGSGDSDGVGGGFYQVDKATMETDRQRGINLAKMIGGTEGAELRKFYESIDTGVRGSEQSPEVQEALFMAHMLEDAKTNVGDILRSGSLTPEQQKKIFEDNWYEGVHRPTQKQRNTPGYREGRINLFDSYFDKYQNTL